MQSLLKAMDEELMLLLKLFQTNSCALAEKLGLCLFKQTKKEILRTPKVLSLQMSEIN